jgi:hypothetical protein
MSFTNINTVGDIDTIQPSDANKITSLNECPICYEVIDTKNNNCITPCGHEFCFKCLMKSISRNNRCPCCRAELQESDENDEILTDSESENDSDSDSNSESSEDGEIECDVEKITKTLVEKGFTMIDFVAIIIDRFPKGDPKYTSQFCEELYDDFYKNVEIMDEEVTREFREIELMASNDERSESNNASVNLLPGFDAIRLNLLPAFNMSDSNLEPFVRGPIAGFEEPNGLYLFL